jgi:hypothetical protein
VSLPTHKAKRRPASYRALARQVDDLGARRRQGNDRFRRKIIHRIDDMGAVMAFDHRDARIMECRDKADRPIQLKRLDENFSLMTEPSVLSCPLPLRVITTALVQAF